MRRGKWDAQEYWQCGINTVALLSTKLCTQIRKHYSKSFTEGIIIFFLL